MQDVVKTVGRYEVLKELGRGGMAVVYLARQTDLDRFVALKELGAFHAADPSFAQRFLRESRVSGSLSHPNIVTVHDYFEFEGTPYIAMELVDGGSLRPHIGAMTLAHIAGVLEGLLAGLAHAGTQGIVHRDLKPENVMVTSEGRVKIADFGIAKATNRMQTGAFLTATGTTVGTPTYMAPEQAMAQQVGPSTDLYSVGCMAYEMVVGRPPFWDSEAPMAILLRHVNERIPSAHSVNEEVDVEISTWIDQLLVKDPKARTQSAAAAWDVFEEIVIGKLGPRWRREARLTAPPGASKAPKPLTPAPFEATQGANPEYESYTWGRAAPPSGPEPAVPPTETPPGAAAPASEDAVSTPPEAAAHAPAPEDPVLTPLPQPDAPPPEAVSFEPAAPAPVPPETVTERRDESDAGRTAMPKTALPPQPEPGPRAAPSPLPNRRVGRSRTVAWLAGLVLLLVGGVAAAMMLRPEEEPAATDRATEPARPVERDVGAYRLLVPAGWELRCRDLAKRCENIELVEGVRRTALRKVGDGDVMQIDRSPVPDGGLDLRVFVDDVDTSLRGLEGYAIAEEARTMVMGGRRVRRFTFTRDSVATPRGIVFAFEASGDAFAVLGLGEDADDIRRTTEAVAASVEPVS